jgi:hypothetical protein
MPLIQLLENRGSAIIAQALEAMSRAHLKNYEAAGIEQMRQRLRAFYELVVQCVRERNLTPIRVYAKTIATERFASGFDLWEVQTAFNVLEEAIWLRLLKELQPAQLAEALGLVSTILGAGKDTLARTYIGLASKTHAPSLNVQFLFAGTEGKEQL